MSMTVAELKEILKTYPDHYVVTITEERAEDGAPIQRSVNDVYHSEYFVGKEGFKDAITLSN